MCVRASRTCQGLPSHLVPIVSHQIWQQVAEKRRLLWKGDSSQHLPLPAHNSPVLAQPLPACPFRLVDSYVLVYRFTSTFFLPFQLLYRFVYQHARLCLCLCVQVHTIEALDKWTPQIGGENLSLHVYSSYDSGLNHMCTCESNTEELLFIQIHLMQTLRIPGVQGNCASKCRPHSRRPHATQRQRKKNMICL